MTTQTTGLPLSFYREMGYANREEYLLSLKPHNTMTTDTTTQTATIETITPDKAKVYLSLSDGNKARKYGTNKADIDRLVDIINSGGWRVTPDGIAFHQDGSLVNAHHRLSAILKSGKTVKMWVHRGLDDDDVKALDQGRKRSISDITGLNKEIAAALNFAARRAITDHRSPLISEIEMLHRSAFGENLERLYNFCQGKAAVFSTAPSKCAAAYWMIHGNADYVMKQYRALCLHNYEDQSQIAKRFSAAVASGSIKSSGNVEVLLAAMRVYDESCKDHQRLKSLSESHGQFATFIRSIVSSIQ